MKKILIVGLILILIVGIALSVFLLNKHGSTSNQPSVNATEPYILNENLIFENNLEEILKQGNLSKLEQNGEGEDLYVASNFGNSNVKGDYVYMVRDGEIKKTYFYSTCSFTKYFAENHVVVNTEESMKEIMSMEKDNLDAVYEMAKGIYTECTDNYGITNFTFAIKDPNTHDDTTMPNCHSEDEFLTALKPLIDGTTNQATFMGFAKDGYCYRITISNAQLFLAFNVEAFK